MTKIKEKLLVASQDEDALKVLEQFGLTKDVIEGYNELDKPATLDEALKQFNLQSDFDKRVDKALKTREENLKAKYDFVEKEQPKDPSTDTGNPALDALMAKLTKLESKLEEQEKEKQQLTIQQRKAQFEAKLESKKIPTIYASVFDPEKDLDEQLSAVEERFTKEFPEATKSKGIRLPNPQRGDDQNKPSKEDEKAFEQSF